jgi:SAM-dependent methyltransferase
VTAAYDLGVDGYVNVWSEVILPAAHAVVAAMSIAPGAVVADVGGGSGALAPSIAEHAGPNGRVIVADASVEMLRAARARTTASVVHADALALPFRNGGVDAVLLAYVLFHVADPGRALSQAALVVRPGGTVGTVTWAHETPLPAFDVWDRTLRDAGAPVPPLRRVDKGLDSPDAIAGALARAGFAPDRVWLEPLRHQWTPESYLRLATGSGVNQLRLAALEPRARDAVVDRARERLGALEPDAFAWSGEVVCAVATRSARL